MAKAKGGKSKMTGKVENQVAARAVRSPDEIKKIEMVGARPSSVRQSGRV